MVVRRDPFSAPPILPLFSPEPLLSPSSSLFLGSRRHFAAVHKVVSDPVWFVVLSHGLGRFAPASILSLDGFLLVRGSGLAGCCWCSYEFLSFAAGCGGFGSL